MRGVHLRLEHCFHEQLYQPDCSSQADVALAGRWRCTDNVMWRTRRGSVLFAAMSRRPGPALFMDRGREECLA
jgi:hypothetical protein